MGSLARGLWALDYLGFWVMPEVARVAEHSKRSETHEQRSIFIRSKL